MFSITAVVQVAMEVQQELWSPQNELDNYTQAPEAHTDIN